ASGEQGLRCDGACTNDDREDDATDDGDRHHRLAARGALDVQTRLRLFLFLDRETGDARRAVVRAELIADRPGAGAQDRADPAAALGVEEVRLYRPVIDRRSRGLRGVLRPALLQPGARAGIP